MNRRAKASVPKKTLADVSKSRGKIVSAGQDAPKKSDEVLIGVITHYFSRIQVVVLKITKGTIQIGDRIHLKGKGTDFYQKVGSLQIESLDVSSAHKGQLVGLKVDQHVSEGSKVFK